MKIFATLTPWLLFRVWKYFTPHTTEVGGSCSQSVRFRWRDMRERFPIKHSCAMLAPFHFAAFEKGAK